MKSFFGFNDCLNQKLFLVVEFIERNVVFVSKILNHFVKHFFRFRFKI